MSNYESPTSTRVKVRVQKSLLQSSYNEDNNERMRRDGEYDF